MKVTLTRLQIILLGLGTLLVIASVFAPWFNVVTYPDLSTEPLGGIQFISEANYFLLYQGSYGTVYSPLVPIILTLLAVACMVFNVRYAPTLLSSLALGADIGNLVKILRFSCDACGVHEVKVAPGIILSMAGCTAVVAASFLEGKPDDDGAEAVEAAPVETDTGEDDADAWFEEKE